MKITDVIIEGEGNFVGDFPQPNIGGATVKPMQVGDTVSYFGQTAKIQAQSPDRKHSRIAITKGTGGVVQTVLTSDLKRVHQGLAEGMAQDEAEEYSGWRAELVNQINYNTFEVKMTNTRSKESANFIVRPVDMISHGPTLQIETMDVHDLQTGQTASWTSDDPQPDGGIVYAIAMMFWDNKELQKKLWTIVDQSKDQDLMPGLDQRRSIGQEVDADAYIDSQEKTQDVMAKMKKGMAEGVETDAKVYQNKMTGKFVAWVLIADKKIDKEGDTKEEALQNLINHIESLKASRTAINSKWTVIGFTAGFVSLIKMSNFFAKFNNGKLLISDQPGPGYRRVSMSGKQVSPTGKFAVSEIQNAGLDISARYDIVSTDTTSEFKLKYHSPVYGTWDTLKRSEPSLTIQMAGRNTSQQGVAEEFRPTTGQAMGIRSQTAQKMNPDNSKFVWKRPNQIMGSHSENELRALKFKYSTKHNVWGGTQQMWNRLEGTLKEFARGGADRGGGNYFKSLAQAWYYNGVHDFDLQGGVKTQQDVERLLQRGIVCPDGVTRKFGIDYNAGFNGVVISSDDYYEHSDHGKQPGTMIDVRTGQPWGPYDYMEFSEDDLDEGVAEGFRVPAQQILGTKNRAKSAYYPTNVKPKVPKLDKPLTDQELARLTQLAGIKSK